MEKNSLWSLLSLFKGSKMTFSEGFERQGSLLTVEERYQGWAQSLGNLFIFRVLRKSQGSLGTAYWLMSWCFLSTRAEQLGPRGIITPEPSSSYWYCLYVNERKKVKKAISTSSKVKPGVHRVYFPRGWKTTIYDLRAMNISVLFCLHF